MPDWAHIGSMYVDYNDAVTIIYHFTKSIMQFLKFMIIIQNLYHVDLA